MRTLYYAIAAMGIIALAAGHAKAESATATSSSTSAIVQALQAN
jgi:hypothetical protein